uniref:PDZ domain-containing protein n=1 Tax=Echeneis naucrates TaxID=173247 RepID=A0A665WIB1_ECHNA
MWFNASSPHEASLHMIELEKDPTAHGLGISLSGDKGGSRARMSVYVADIDPQGPGAAMEDGRLKRGDQIIAVNGHCLEGVTHAEAVDILKKTKGSRTFLTLQWTRRSEIRGREEDNKEANEAVSRQIITYCILVCLLKVFVMHLCMDMHHFPCKHAHE